MTPTPRSEAVQALEDGEVESLATCDTFTPGRRGEYCQCCGNSKIRHVVRALTTLCKAQLAEIRILTEELQEERAAHSHGGVGA